MDDQIKMETKGSSFYVYGITEKPIKIPSQLYPVQKTYKKYPTSEKMLREVNPQNIFMILNVEE